MRRNYRYDYGTSSVQRYDRMKIAPPLFSSIADAYRHFVRHPEERQIVDNPDGWRPFGTSLDDCFDRMDSFVDGLPSPSVKTAPNDNTPPLNDYTPPPVEETEEVLSLHSEVVDPS